MRGSRGRYGGGRGDGSGCVLLNWCEGALWGGKRGSAGGRWGIKIGPHLSLKNNGSPRTRLYLLTRNSNLNREVGYNEKSA